MRRRADVYSAFPANADPASRWPKSCIRFSENNVVKAKGVCVHSMYVLFFLRDREGKELQLWDSKVHLWSELPRLESIASTPLPFANHSFS
jgi:hypothetical protein